MGLLALALAIIALVQVHRLEREVRALQRALADLARSRSDRDLESRTVPVSPPSPVHTREPAAPSRPHEASWPPRLPPAPPATPHRRPEPVIAASAATVDAAQQTLESRIGERLFLYAGMIVLVLGIAFFLRYAFEHEWISPTVRVWLGAASGLGFLAAGRALAARDYRQYGLFVSGGGLAILFLSAYSAHAFYGLIGQLPAFVLLAGIAAGAAYLAHREASLPLALMAVCGGFVTPFLVGGDSDAHVVLFLYDAALIAATMFLARMRQWPWLNVVSLTLTIVTVAAWADRHYTADLHLRIELLLTLFCGLFVAALIDARRADHPDARTVSAILWIAPAAYHLASLLILYDHAGAFLIYLVAASVALVAASLATDAPLVRLSGWVAVILPLLLFLANRPQAGQVTGAPLAAVLVWLTFVAGPVRVARSGRALSMWDIALVHASGNGAFAGVYFALYLQQPPPVIAMLAAALSLSNGALAWWLRATPSALHWFGVACALAAVAVAVGLQGTWTVVMWAVEAAVMFWLGSAPGKRWLRIAGLVLFGVAVWRWLVEAQPASGLPFTVLLNARALSALFVIGVMYLAAYVTRTVSLLDGAHRVERAVLLVGASVVTVLALSTEIWTYWNVRGAGDPDAVLARELMLSAAWAGYAGLLVALGMRYHYPPVRYFAISLFGLTLLKVFAVDAQQLEGFYRVLAFIVVGAILLLASFLYQRSRKTDQGR